MAEKQIDFTSGPRKYRLVVSCTSAPVLAPRFFACYIYENGEPRWNVANGCVRDMSMIIPLDDVGLSEASKDLFMADMVTAYRLIQ